MITYEYPKSRALFKRAVQLIPAGIYGHLGPSEGCMTPVDAYPFYATKAKGSYFWDLDGNRFLDLMCAYGPNVLGYGDEDVDRAAIEQLRQINCASLASPVMVELAELLVDTVDCADWAFFCKNGGDVTQFASMVARAATGRKTIVKFKGGYHGVAPWMQEIGYPGITDEDVANVRILPFNNAEFFRNYVEEHPNEIAALISTPYHHPTFGDNAVPKEGFWPEVRRICDEHGIVLILDDVRAGFRLDLRGSDAYYGFRADLICFCKAIANGYNLSALCGRDELKTYAGSVFFTGSYWLSAMPMAAAVATISKLKEVNGPAIMREKGLAITAAMQAAVAREGFKLKVSGEPAMFFMRFEDDPNHVKHQLWVAECVRRGVFMTNHHNHFINCSIAEEDIAFAAEVAGEAARATRRILENPGSY